MEARINAAKQRGRSDLLNGSYGNDRDRMRLNGRTPKNHARENVDKMRRESKERKQRQAEQEAIKTEKANFKLSRFQQVDARATRQAEDIAHSVSTHDFMKAKSGRTAAGPSEALSSKRSDEDYERREKSKPRVPRASEIAPAMPADERNRENFINRNASKAIRNDVKNRARPKQTEHTLPERRSARGQVPAYIVNRKREDEMRRREMEAFDPNCPHGMKKMIEDERMEALSVLHENKASLTKQLHSLPFSDSLSVIKRKQHLQGELEDIEGAIDIFSKPTVYVSA